MSFINKIILFFNETKAEMKRVNWPTRQETVKYTLIVIGISGGVALFLGGLDFLFNWLLDKFII